MKSSVRVCVCSLCGSQICLAEVGPGPVMLTAAGEPRLRRPKFGFWFVVCSFDHRFYTGVRSFMFCSGVGDPLAASQCNGLTMRSRGRVLAQKLRRGPKQEFPGLPLYTLSSPCVCVCTSWVVSLHVVVRIDCTQTLPVLAGWLSLFGHSDSKNTRMNSGGFGLIHAAIPSRRWEQIGFVP